MIIFVQNKKSCLNFSTKELTFFSFRAADEHLVEQHDSALYSTAVPYLLRTALPLSSCSLLLAWASNAFASSCSMPAFLLASADSSVFLVMRSSTVLYLLFSSVSRTCCSTHKHKMEPLKRQCRGSCPISGLRRAVSAQVTKTATGSRDFLLNMQDLKSPCEDSSVSLAHLWLFYSSNTNTAWTAVTQFWSSGKSEPLKHWGSGGGTALLPFQ